MAKMNFNKSKLGLIFWLSLFFPAFSSAQLMDPLGLMLSWQEDPTTTMTIDWHTAKKDKNSELRYRVLGDKNWETISGERLDYPYDKKRKIHRLHLKELTPNTTYEFKVGDYDRIRKFKTMPESLLDRPIRYAEGGDMMHRKEWLEKTNRQIAKYEPDFVVWGGDLSYANGLAENVNRWHDFFDAVMHTLVTPDGRTLPFISAVGNHEIIGGYHFKNDHDNRKDLPEYEPTDESRQQIAPYYFQFFAFPGLPGYATLDFGQYLSIIMLDTDHANPIEGEQTEWLAKTLEAKKDFIHVLPHYHVPAYPSVRNRESKISQRIIENWLPLFQEHQIPVVFEHHDHAYKRTFPMKDGAPHEKGIVHIGDGAWGVGTRTLNTDDQGEQPEYIYRSEERRHGLIVTLDHSQMHIMVVDEDGFIIDEYPDSPHTPSLNYQPNK